MKHVWLRRREKRPQAKESTQAASRRRQRQEASLARAPRGACPADTWVPRTPGPYPVSDFQNRKRIKP